MKEIQFKSHFVNARKDLLHFVEENADKEVYKHIGEKPDEWKDELNIISHLLIGEGLIGGTGINLPPINDSEFRELGGNLFLYRGNHTRERGLWKKKDLGKKMEELIGNRFEWTQYSIGTKAVLKINQQFSDIPIETFLPENFEKISEEVEKEKGIKRPIWKFAVQTNGTAMNVYAKGADITYGFYYSYAQPKFRLTPISSIQKTTSKEEMEITIELSKLGINVPEIVGYYKASVEEFLFLSEVKGKSPDNFFNTHRKEIIEQDAEMLGKVCLAGYRKQGFEDFDDKIFDGKDLYLIDVDEYVDLYYGFRDYRKVLLNSKETSGLRDFRKMQKATFKGALKDVLSEYRKSLTPTREDMEYYARIFYKSLGWKEPSQKQLSKLTTFSDDYMTQDRFMSIMSDTD